MSRIYENNEIIDKKDLAPSIKLMKIYTPLIAKKAKPGNFIIIRIHENGERFPLTIVDNDKNNGAITIIFQEVGKSTKLLGNMNIGQKILDIVGPLGNPTNIENYGNVCCIGGGVGVACIYPIAKALKEAGNKLIIIIGARNSSLLILEEELKNISDEFYVCTDDGSKGFHGFVTDMLKKLLNEKKKIDIVYAVGPAIMMKAVSEITKPYKIKTIVSLNPIMVDGTGMCGACRIEIDGETKFTCVHGPEFDGHKVNFDLLLRRLKMYEKYELEALSSLK
jgi:ferredoxin--NADP+ reductase